MKLDICISLGLMLWLSPLVDMWHNKVEEFYDE
jgi:hypothetical protein